MDWHRDNERRGRRSVWRLDVRILGVGAAHTVTRFTGDGFVFELGELLQQLGMTFVTGLFAGIDWFT